MLDLYIEVSNGELFSQLDPFLSKGCLAAYATSWSTRYELLLIGLFHLVLDEQAVPLRRDCD